MILNEHDEDFVAAVGAVVRSGLDPATGKPAMLLPRGMLDRKPPHGAPCNRCGLCCLATLCDLGQHVFRQKLGPCPALRRDAGTGDAVCGLVVEPEKYAPRRALVVGKTTLRDAATLLIGSGDGCDARFNGEPRNVAFDARLNVRDREPGRTHAARKAKRVWGAKPW